MKKAAKHKTAGPIGKCQFLIDLTRLVTLIMRLISLLLDA